MSIIRADNGLSAPSDIDGFPELPGRYDAIYGPDSFARHRGGVAVGERTGHLASPNFCGVRLRWSTPSALQPAKQPRGGFIQSFKRLLGFFAHDEQQTTGAKAWRTQTKGIRNP